MARTACLSGSRSDERRRPHPGTRPTTGSRPASRGSDARTGELSGLPGEAQEMLSHELGITAATLSGWREAFLDDGRAALKSRPADDRDELTIREGGQ